MANQSNDVILQEQFEYNSMVSTIELNQVHPGRFHLRLQAPLYLASAAQVLELVEYPKINIIIIREYIVGSQNHPKSQEKLTTCAPGCLNASNILVLKKASDAEAAPERPSLPLVENLKIHLLINEK